MLGDAPIRRLSARSTGGSHVGSHHQPTQCDSVPTKVLDKWDLTCVPRQWPTLADRQGLVRIEGVKRIWRQTPSPSVRSNCVADTQDPADGLTVDFVVESVPSQLTEIADRVRDGHLHTHIGTVATLDDAIPALNPVERRKGKAVIHAHP